MRAGIEISLNRSGANARILLGVHRARCTPRLPALRMGWRIQLLSVLLGLLFSGGITAEAAVGRRIVADSILMPGEEFVREFPAASFGAIEVGLRFDQGSSMFVASSRDDSWRLTISADGRDILAVDISRIKERFSTFDDTQIVRYRVEELDVESGAKTLSDGILNEGRAAKENYVMISRTPADSAGISRYEILAGSEKYQLIGTWESAMRPDRCSIQCSAPAQISSVNLLLSDENQGVEMADADFLERIDANDFSGNEGIYEYLDCELESKLATLGGRYQLALLGNPRSGYTIIYQGRAEENAERWRSGMVKGRMTPTAFENQYNLDWTPARGAETPQEAWAEFTAGPILILHFPRQKGVVRFARRR